MIYVILGMHKSGTTLIAQMLHDSGINMVEVADSSASYERGNKYERLATLDVNIELLSAHGLRSIDAVPLGDLQANDAQMDSVARAIGSCRSLYHDWGFKDPRTCLTYHIWHKCLPPHRLVIVYRDYEEVLAHYRKKYRRELWSIFPFTRVLRVLRAWTLYNEKIVDIVRNTDQPCIVINYSQLMSDDAEFRRFSSFVDRDLVDTRNSELYRSQSSRSGRISLPEKVALSRLQYAPVRITRTLEEMRSAQIGEASVIRRP